MASDVISSLTPAGVRSPPPLCGGAAAGTKSTRSRWSA